MKRILLFLCFAASVQAQYSQISFITTTSSSQALPAGWNNADNRVSCIGSGGNGSARVSTSQGGNGGGGGAFARSTNVTLGAGPVGVQVGTAGGTAVTWIKNTSGTIQVQADYGRNATTANNGHGVGGVVANCTGTVKQNGGNGGDSVVADAGAGGGGSGGPSGDGGAGAVGTTVNGGSADGGVVGQQTTQGATGNSGTEFDGTHGCGGGGAGGVGGGSRAGGAGGTYGGAGGGCDSGTAAAGAGKAGLIILEWNPVVAPNTGFLQMFP